ncbi:MAG TPA: flavin reductase family protein [Gemmatimonadaceae bacterium]|nr:flavin reductase family protein [Gemmatimonadaceae bacterium]
MIASPPLVSADAYRAALSRFASGVTVVTSRDALGVDYGMTVSAFASLSLSPPLVLVCIDQGATWHAALDHSSHFVVHVLGEDQEGYSRRFASERAEKFSGLELERTASGVLRLPDALATLECRITARHREGDHTIVIGAVEHTELREAAGDPLLYFRGRYARLAP